MPTTREALEFLSRHFPPTAADGIVVKGPVYRQAGSRIYYVEHPALPCPAALKLCLKPYTETPDTAEARQQYEALDKVHAAMRQHAAFSVPRPLYAAYEEGIVLLEWIDGESLTQRLSRLGTPPAEKYALAERAGAWLRHFHGAHPLPAGPLDVNEKLDALHQAQTRSCLSHPHLQRALALLVALSPAVRRETLPMSWIHGDFKSDNLIISGPRTIGIDIYVQHENACIHDLASFLNRLALHCSHPRHWHLLPLRGQLDQAFLRGYARPGDDQPQQLPLIWLRIYSLLSLWSRVSRRKAPGPGRWYLRQTFLRALRPLCHQAQACQGGGHPPSL